MNSLLPFICRSVGGRTIRLLLDTGAAKNYICSLSVLKGITTVNKQFNVRSIHGKNQITHKCKILLFGVKTTFFLLPALKVFHAIVGFDFLRKVHSIINLRDDTITTDNGLEKLLFYTCSDVNSLWSEIDVPLSIRDKFECLMARQKAVFSEPDESLPFNTNIVATIRTIDNDPIYSKLYSYPMGLSNFVNKEITALLKSGIIRPSRSPYNNPLWVVDKKGYDEEGKRNKRLVVDFRKLNDKTIDDKYPIPDITNILSNLGKGKYFTTLDLRSGFHQILLAEKDREKTSFSVNNGKYEFCRLPFGLKNAPSIFQRAIDDVLRENIGKFLHVYVDDIIIYSKDMEDHIEHINWVLQRLLDSNMRVSLEKSHFFKTKVEYLGFLVSSNGVRTCPDKVEAIANFPEPENLYELRSFLGLAGYYRRFIKDFAGIAKPLTEILKGDNGKVSAGRSKKVKVSFNAEQSNAFSKLRQILSSEEVILLYPDFAKPFELTTDASSLGLGAVLSQNGRPITMISRTLKQSEENYATNERELLAIVWALKKLRNYLYGAKCINIFTDHQPLSFAVSEKNTNAKIQRWKSFIEEHNAKISYKPGKENHVADALSRQQINLIDSASIEANHSEESLTNVILSTDRPVNCYKNQIIIEEATTPSINTIIMFRSKKRHIVQYSSLGELIDLIKDIVDVSSVNAIHCDLHTLAHIQHRLVTLFPATKFWYSSKRVMDVTNNDEQKEIILNEHRRAHRSIQNVIESVLKDYYFPKMAKLATEMINNCRICQESKYVRHPVRQELGITPIPTIVGEQIHVDIFSTDRKYFLTCLDKFSKFAIAFPIPSRNMCDISVAILELINFFPNLKFIYCDNEGSFSSHSFQGLLEQFNIQVSHCPPMHSTSNGQVERFHSTLIEISRCIKKERSLSDTVEVILQSVIEYNKSIHTVVKEKPANILHSSSSELLKDIFLRLEKAQALQNQRENNNRIHRNFNLGDNVMVKQNKRLGNKLSPLFVQGRVEADLGSTVLINGKIVHKDNIK